MLTNTYLLARLNGQSLRNYLRNLDTGETIRNVIFLVLLVAFFFSGQSLFGRVFRNLLDVELLGGILTFRLISMVFLTFMVMLLFSNAVTALACLYMSRDLDYLLAQPLTMKTVYLYKYVQSTFHSSWMVLIFGGPVLVAYGRAVAAPWWYYPSSFLLLIPFSFIPAAVGVLFINCIMYFVPLARIRYVLVTIGFVFCGLLVSFLRMLNPRQLFDPKLFTNLKGYLESFKSPLTDSLPNHFAATAINAWAAGDAAWLPCLKIIGLGIGLSAVAVVIGGLLYFHGIASGDQGSAGGRWSRRPLLTSSSPVRVLMGKEIAMFLREPTQWSQLLILLSIIVVHLVNIHDLPLDTWYLHNFISFMNLGLVGGVMVAVAVRFIFPTVSLEGEGFWLLATAPVPLRKLFWSKFHLHFWPLAIAAELLAFVANYTLRATPFMYSLSVLMVAIMAATLTAMGILLGALFPRFAYNHVSDIATSAGGMIYMMVALIYVGATVVFLTVPVYVYFFERLNWHLLWRPVSWHLGLLVVVNLVLFFGSCGWSYRALERLMKR